MPGEIVGMTPHAHQLATRMSATLTHAERQQRVHDRRAATGTTTGSSTTCTRAACPTSRTTSSWSRCEYDNSAAHQPVVDGAQLAPRNVTWGEGSLDEMCLHYVWLRFEREAFLSARGL